MFWYKLVFMAELLLAELLFTYKLKKRSRYVLRALLAAAFCMGIAFVFYIVSYNALFTSVMFLALFGISALTLKFVYDEPWTTLIFCAPAAYTTQHLAYEVYTFFIIITGLDSGMAMGAYGDGSGETSPYNGWTAIVYIASYSVLYWLMFVLFGDRINRNEDLSLKNIKLISLSGCIIVINIVLNAIVTYNSEANYDKVYLCVAHISNILCCLFALLLQFGMVTRKKLEHERDMVRHLWEKDKEQYTLSKENIDIINLKCHDLRHQIREIGNRRVLDEDAIKEIESAIKIYDGAVKTGNEALDVILTEKSLYCQNNDITFSCIIDGKNFEFMSPGDVYSLFGNAIENAIEAVLKIDNPDKRLINLVTHRTGKLLSVRLDNCISDAVKIENGLPVTQKEDKRFHGFGTKSIKAITDKYNGDLSFAAEDGVFSINILFPLI